VRNRCFPDHNIGSRNWSHRMAGTLRRISIRDELFPGRPKGSGRARAVERSTASSVPHAGSWPVASETFDTEGPFDEHGRILVTSEALARVTRSI
jgi:hypothetical protein